MKAAAGPLLKFAAISLILAFAPSAVAGKKPTCSRTRPCDTTPPSVAILTPTDGATIAGLAPENGTATDNKEVASVAIQVDGGQPVPASGTTDWTATIDTRGLTDGTHVITAKATDAAGNAATSSITVTVTNTAAPPPPPPVSAPPMVSGTIGGYAFRETDRDGVYEADETALGGQHVFLFDGAGNFLRNTDTDASGWYQFTAVPSGTYRVEFSPQSWFGIREDLAPDTTGSLHPRRSVDLVDVARLDFGWRPMVRSNDSSAPVTSYVGPNGLTVRSSDDVVPAKDIYDRLVTGSLVGTEAQFVTIRFDFVKAGFTSTSVTQSNGGPYEDYRAVSDVTYLSWLDGDNELFHEYGHAWSLYYAYIVKQDPSLTAYLAARGLAGDPRVNSSYEWNVREMIAEDYRQLFGTQSARSASQMNSDVPPAPTVAGLMDFLSGAFLKNGA